MDHFGAILREYRQGSNDPEFPGRRLSQGRLGELLSRELKLSKAYSAAAISDWEREASRIHADNRFLLVCLIKTLRHCGGLTTVEKANNFLLAGNYRPLDQSEIAMIFPHPQNEEAHDVDAQKLNTLSKVSEYGMVFENWPPGIPYEPYYPLPQREEILNSLLKLVQKDNGPRIISIEGLGGQGKTALAVELARRALQIHAFEGIVGETAKQEIFAAGDIIHLQRSTLDYEGLLDGLARQLQRWELFAMATKEKEVLISQLFSQRRYLIIVDNLETAENAQAIATHLGSILGSSRAIVTSREKLRSSSVHSITLQGLSLNDSKYYLRVESQRVGTNVLLERVGTTLAEIHELTGGSPLAMKLIIAQAKYLDLDWIMEQLRNAKGKLFPFVFLHSWEQLQPEAQKLLLYIGKTVAESVSLNELNIAGLAETKEVLVTAIDQLVAYSLLNYSRLADQVRYGIHPLTRQFIVNDLPSTWREQGLL
jgi:hypothetical protein